MRPPARLCRLFHMFHVFQLFHLFQVFLKRTLSLKNETKRPDLGNFDPFFDEITKKADKCSTVFQPHPHPVEQKWAISMFRRRDSRPQAMGLGIWSKRQPDKSGTQNCGNLESGVWKRRMPAKAGTQNSRPPLLIKEGSFRNSEGPAEGGTQDFLPPRPLASLSRAGGELAVLTKSPEAARGLRRRNY